MPTLAEWEVLIVDAYQARPAPLRAETFIRGWHSYSKPAAVSCSDGFVYVIKGLQSGRADMARPMCNDQIVGRLGNLAAAPVADVALVDVADLVAVEPHLAYLEPAIAHATRLVPDCSDRMWLDYAHLSANRERFGALCGLYSWAHAGDHQVIYENQPPHLVYSVDHGHFFPGGPQWATAHLQGAPAVAIDGAFATAALTKAEMAPAVGRFAALSSAAIAAVVSVPPDEWGLTLQERISLADYLDRRKLQLGPALVP